MWKGYSFWSSRKEEIMKEIISSLAALAVCHQPLYSISLTTAPVQEQTPTSVVETPSWIAQIEREMRKHDSWVEWYVEQDYTNVAQEGHAHLRTIPRPFQGGFVDPENGSGMYFIGMWDYNLNNLILPEPWNERHGMLVLDSVDHELWHALYDDGKGIMTMDGYTGPSSEELHLYCFQNAIDPAYKPVEQEIEALIKDATVSIVLSSEEERSALLGRLFASSFLSPGLEELLTEQEKAILNRNTLRITLRYFSYSKEVLEIERAYTSLTDVVDSETEPFLYTKGIEGILERLEQFERYNSLPEEIFYANELRRQMLYSAIIREIDTPIVALQKKILDAPENERTSLENELGTLETKRTELIAQLPAPYIDYSLVQESEEIIGTRNSQIDEVKSRTRARLYDCDELMGRVVNSLGSLYYGPYTYNAAPLTEKDLAFLERFTFNDQPLFRKGVEKYRVGQAMLADGKKPEDVQELLEYATKIEYKGETYEWSEAQFHLVVPGGQLPMSED